MIEKLFIKQDINDKKMTEKSSLNLSENGIKGNIECHKFRQILILPRNTLEEFNIKAGQLKENILINESFDIHSLESGTVIQLGEVKIRLTFHCEPCGKIKNIVSTRKILHKRGYLGQVINSGNIKIGDSITILKKEYESIPYKLGDRIKWYLDTLEKPIPVSELVVNIGLSKSYCRAVPNIIRNRSDIDKRKILYKKDQKKESTQLILPIG